MNPAERLHKHLRSEAVARNLQLQDDPTAFTQRRMRTSAVRPIGPDELPDVEQPAIIFGFLAKSADDQEQDAAGQYAVLIGSLAEAGEDEEAVGEVWRRYHGQAAVARSWLPEAVVDDLYLILTGPEGSAESPFWITQAGEIERNDFICRKLVWLPPSADANERELRESLELLVSRTFLAQPWKVEATNIQKSLDALATNLLALPDLGVPSETLYAWLNLLETSAQEGGDPDALVAQLIKSMGSISAP